MRSFVNYRRYHIGDYFTYYTTSGLEDLLTSGSLHGSLSPIKKWCWMAKPHGSLGTGPVLDFHNLPDNIRSCVRIVTDDYVLHRNINSHTDCQILQDALNSLAQCHRLIGNYNLTLPNAIE